MQNFTPIPGQGGIAGLISEEPSADAMALTGLIYLMESFDAIDENIVECWNGHCPISDGFCSNFDRRLAIKAFRALRVARESSLAGAISVASNISSLSLTELGETQQADISMTQLWLLNRLWNLCLTHQLVLKQSEHVELCLDFPLYIAEAALLQSKSLNVGSREVHGVGLVSC
jgi:hypothetical protein